jgi:uncharacterized protein with NAD-binding domain and iron-sulfur cluster
MAAAWDLTTPSPQNPEPCDVTIFQMGGRLGGKGASGRNPDRGYRIEEHGLHLWLGYYENAFGMVRECFKELRERVDLWNLLKRRDLMQAETQRLEELKERYGNQPGDSRLLERLDAEPRPFDNWNWLSAFERASLVGLADDSSGDWIPWIARFPEYVHKSEQGVTGVYFWKEGDTERIRPGIHITSDPRRAYPGEESVFRGEDKAAKLDAAFVLSHALRALQAFVDSLELRVEQLRVERGAPLPDDPEELLPDALVLNPMAHPDHLDALTTDLPRALRILRLTFLVPTIQAFASLVRFTEGPIEHALAVSDTSSDPSQQLQAALDSSDEGNHVAYSDNRDRVIALLNEYVANMREKVEEFVRADTQARRTWELIDLLAGHIRGLVAAGLEGTDDFHRLDEYNYEDWLRLNGVAESTLNSSLVRGAYDLALAFHRGDPENPQIAAGQAICAACRFFFLYKGALFWRLKASMGDVVFAPIFLALRCRGVKFRFFHQLTNIGLDEARERVTRLDFRRQVKLRPTDEATSNYEPLIRVKNLFGWGVTPDSTQFDYDAETLEIYKKALDDPDSETYVNFESIWCNWPHGDDVFATVGEGTGTDRPEDDPSLVGHYNAVVVTVPIAALKGVSSQLVRAHSKPGDPGESWRDMLNNIDTVATQSLQLWVNKRTADLGWTHGQVKLSAFVDPFDTWADLSQLVEVEDQPEARGVHYFCSVLPHHYVPADDSDPKQIARRLEVVKGVVKDNARRFLTDSIFHFWPRAVDRYPNAFKWERLVAPADTSGIERFHAQHFVANVDPSDRYTLSLPGSTKYRIHPNRTRFGRLHIAGDWTDCGLNLGCVEAAVISGRLASSGIRGYPEATRIPGYFERLDQLWSEFQLDYYPNGPVSTGGGDERKMANGERKR